MAKYYVDPISGNDSNSGSALQPFASFYKALTVVGVSGEIEIIRGTVRGGDYSITSSQNQLQVYSRLGAIFDCTGFDKFSEVNDNYLQMYNLNFTGWEVGFIDMRWDAYVTKMYNCCIYQKGAKYDTTPLVPPSSEKEAPCLYGCTVFGVRLLAGTSYFSGSVTPWQNCILHSDYAVSSNGSVAPTYCASPLGTEWTGTGGWDTATYPLPLTSLNHDTPDLRLDPNHAQFAKYAIGGSQQAIVGSTGRFVVGYNRNTKQQVDTNVQYGPMVNDDNYYDSGWADITIATGTNDKIDSEEGGSELTSTIAAGIYTSGADFATAIATALNADGTDTYTVTFSTSQRIVLASDGAELNLLWSTGTNTAITAGGDMGFDISSDDTAQTLYTADNPLNGGGAAGRTSVVVSGGTVELNYDVGPTATSARAVTPVIDFGAPQELLRVYLSLAKDGAGEIDDDTSGNRTIQVRGSNIPFDAQDPAGTTTLAWTSIQRDGLETVSHTYRYFQFGFVLRINAV